MGPVLVVGATGQLGLAAVKALLARNHPTRAMIRDASSAARLTALGADTATADLTEPASLRAACEGISCIVATANTSIPSRKSDRFAAADSQGYRNLIEAAEEVGVKRFVFTSVRRPVRTSENAFFRAKRETEQRLRESRMDTVVFQSDAFMDVAFAMMGSRIPIEGAECASVLRPFDFSRNHFESIAGSIGEKHTALIPGDGKARHSFICVADVAEFLAAAVSGGPSGTHVLAGPEALSHLDVVRLFESILGVKLKVKGTPAFVFRVLATVMQPFQPAGANIMFLNYLSATEDWLTDDRAWGHFGVSPRTAERFLRERFAAARAAGGGQ